MDFSHYIMHTIQHIIKCEQDIMTMMNQIMFLFLTIRQFWRSIRNIILQSLRGHTCAREVQRKFFHKWLETYLRCKKIEGDRLKSWCGPRNPRWPPRWRPIFLKMAVYIKLATTTCFFFVFGLKMIILEENRYK